MQIGVQKKRGSRKMDMYILNSIVDIVKTSLVIIISQERRDNGISQETLGRLSGIERTNVNAFESFKRKLGLDSVIKMFHALDLSVEVKGKNQSWNLNDMLYQVLMTSELKNYLSINSNCGEIGDTQTLEQKYKELFVTDSVSVDQFYDKELLLDRIKQAYLADKANKQMTREAYDKILSDSLQKKMNSSKYNLVVAGHLPSATGNVVQVSLKELPTSDILRQRTIETVEAASGVKAISLRRKQRHKREKETKNMELSKG